MRKITKKRSALALLRFRVFHPKAVYRDAFHDLVLERTVRIVGGCLCNLVYHIHTLGHFPKCGITAVSVGAGLMHDKELGAGRVRGGASCHGEDAFRML